MKTTIVNIKRKALAALLAFAVLSVSNIAVASSKEPDSSGKEVKVQYLGTVYGQPLFELNVQNEAGEDLIISLESEDGEVLYSKKSSDKSFTKKIQLATTETNITLNLRVYSTSTKKTQVYEINKITKVTDDLVVNRVRN